MKRLFTVVAVFTILLLSGFSKTGPISNPCYVVLINPHTWDYANWAAPKINGQMSYIFNATTLSGTGAITATPGALVTVTVNAGGPPLGNYVATCQLVNAFFKDGSKSISVTNTTASKKFIMPASGSTGWNGSFTEPDSHGGGYISVQ